MFERDKVHIPPDNTIAPDIPSSFSNKDGVLTYRVFFPAKYLLPMKLRNGWVFGLGLYAADANRPGMVEGALTVAPDGGGCYNKPHFWPAAIERIRVLAVWSGSELFFSNGIEHPRH